MGGNWKYLKDQCGSDTHRNTRKPSAPHAVRTNIRTLPWDLGMAGQGLEAARDRVGVGMEAMG